MLLKPKYPLLIIISLSLSSLLFGNIHIHTKDIQHLSINITNNSARQKIPLDISFNSIQESPFFICFSFGQQSKRKFYNTDSELFQEEKEQSESFSIRGERFARHQKVNQHLSYQLYNNNDPNNIYPLKTSLMATNLNDVLSGVLYDTDSSPIQLNYYLEVLSPIHSIKPGIYYDIFSIDLYAGDISDKLNAKLIESKDVKVIIHIPSSTHFVPIQSQDPDILIFDTKSNTPITITAYQIKDNKKQTLPVTRYDDISSLSPSPDSKIEITISEKDF
eukprot:COSAG01_NODE_3_length_63519_cov_1591.007663_38_plen_276_part_00